MIYKCKIKPIEDELVQLAYEEGMKELNEFWGINWIENTPDICIVDTRKDIDGMKGRKTESWVVGWATNGPRRIFLLNRRKMATESTWKYTKDKYIALIKHELCHLFFEIVSRGRHQPLWLTEGCSICLSGQNKFKKVPDKFSKFLESYSEMAEGLYDEPGFVVEMLIKKFGKEKIIQLVRSLSEIKQEKDFKKKFEELYGFELNYQTVNKL